MAKLPNQFKAQQHSDIKKSDFCSGELFLLPIIYTGMGRILRFLKITFYMTSIGGLMATFSAFKNPPLLGGEGGLISNFQQDIESELAKFQGAQTESLSGVSEAKPSVKVRSKGEAIKVAHSVPAKKSELYFHGGHKWVYINNKYYLYNPKNTYSINGVRTFYKPYIPGDETSEEKRVQAQDERKKSKWAKTTNVSNPMSVYSGKGMANLKKNLAAMKHNMKLRNQILEDLANDDKTSPRANK